MYIIFVPILFLDIIFPYIILRKSKVEREKLDKVLFSRLFTENPSSFTVSEAAATLERYLSLCQTVQEDTKRLIRERKDILSSLV